MAILKWSGIGIVGSSGKIQGTVLLVNNIARVWHKTKTVRNAATNLVKGTLSGISTAFRSLTAAQISGWNAAAIDFKRKNALAEVRTLTGAQAYQRINNILASMTLSGTDDAPGVAIPEAVVHLGAIAAHTGSVFTVAVFGITGAINPLPAHVYARVFATRQVGLSKSKFSKSDYRLIGTFPPTTATPLDIESDYVAEFAPLVAGQRIGVIVQLITYDSGANLFAEAGKIYTDVVVAA